MGKNRIEFTGRVKKKTSRDEEVWVIGDYFEIVDNSYIKMGDNTYKVEKDSVCMVSEFFDINGFEICEGHKVKVTAHDGKVYNGIVAFMKGSFCVLNKDGEYFNDGRFLLADFALHESVEIVGSIFD